VKEGALEFSKVWLFTIGAIIGAGVFVILEQIHSFSGDSLIYGVFLAFFPPFFTVMAYLALAHKDHSDLAEFNYFDSKIWKVFSAATIILSFVFILAIVAWGFSDYVGVPFSSLWALLIISLLPDFLSELAALFVALFLVSLPFFSSFHLAFPEWIVSLKAASYFFFAYLGFNAPLAIYSKIKHKNLVPLAMFSSLFSVLILYSFAAFFVMSGHSFKDNAIASFVAIFAILTTLRSIFVSLSNFVGELFSLSNKGRFFAKVSILLVSFLISFLPPLFVSGAANFFILLHYVAICGEALRQHKHRVFSALAMFFNFLLLIPLFNVFYLVLILILWPFLYWVLYGSGFGIRIRGMK